MVLNSLSMKTSNNTQMKDMRMILRVFCGIIIHISTLGERSTGSANHVAWMSTLPKDLLDAPLSGIAIPGSHDSASYSLDLAGGLAPGIPNKIRDILDASKALKGGEEFVKREIYRWSKTQSYNISQQLQLGIRYFDLRVLYSDQKGELFTYHGLIGAPLSTIFIQMASFLRINQREVLILDFNHLNILSNVGMDKLENALSDAFGRKIYRTKTAKVCLSDLWRDGRNVVVFFKGTKRRNFKENENFALDESKLLSPFDESKFYESSTWMNFLKDNYKNRPYNGTFYVTQGIMQPNLLGIVASSLTKAGSLETWTAQEATKLLVKWLPTCKRGIRGINIVMADFVQKYNFTETVLQLNVRK